MNNSSTVRRRRSASEWAAIVEQSKSSQQSVRAYCASVGVAVSAFYQWRSKLMTAEKEKPKGFTPVALRQAPLPAVSPCAVEVRLANGRTVRITGTEVNATFVRAVIAVAEEVGSC